MKDRKKPRGPKHRIRESKKREQRIAIAITLSILIAIISVSSFFIHSRLNQPSTDDTASSTGQPKAAIVDHLSLTAPNQSFIEIATNILEEAGYMVDYYPGEKVTVEFYRNLPTHGHELIILRVHSAITVGSGPIQGALGLFTSEVRSETKYVYEQLTGQLVGAEFPNEETVYFGIGPLFVLNSVEGRFQNTTIIQMGCDGLVYTTMAEAFIQKGAQVYISWTGDVSASHTDQATTQLLKHLVTQKRTIKQALRETLMKVGPDPAYQSLLIYYPFEVGDQTIKDITGNQTTKP